MSDQQGAGTETGAPATTTTAQTPPAQVAPPPKTPQPADENEPWFKERLTRAEEQARQKVLEELGVKDAAKAKKAIEAAAKAEEEAKTVAEKLADEVKNRTKAESALERERAINREWATRQMMALTAEQQAVVKSFAGDDPSEQLASIAKLAPVWAKQTTEATATRPLAQQVTTPASGTAPPPHAPEGGTQQSPPNHKEVHTALLKTNPFAAAEYGLAHAREVFPETQQ